ncbi:MAG: TraR/DksA family transcriptional regulator [Acidobacteriaceae bacterium]
MRKQVSATQIYREKLLEQKARLERSVLSTIAQGRNFDADDILDPADQAVMSYQRELMFSQGTNERTHLSLIRLALERLNDGSYGECLMCGDAIGAKRLEAVPWTPYCIRCQEKIENGELDEAEQAA